jgi:hypothetical protein
LPDCGRDYTVVLKYPVPKINSLFAKCYVRENQLHVLYTQAFFKKLAEKHNIEAVFYKQK